MGYEWKAGDWADYMGDRVFVFRLGEQGNERRVYFVNRADQVDFSWNDSTALVHLPQCTGWNWVAPEPIKPSHRAFANADEFEQFRERWITRLGCDGSQTDGYWKPVGYDDKGVWSVCDNISYKMLFEKYSFDVGWQDGKRMLAPCGVQVGLVTAFTVKGD